MQFIVFYILIKQTLRYFHFKNKQFMVYLIMLSKTIHKYLWKPNFVYEHKHEKTSFFYFFLYENNVH